MACERGFGSEGNPLALYHEKGHGVYDIAHPAEDPFPQLYAFGYLNQHWVQEALGVPVNHSAVSQAVHKAFELSGDLVKSGFIEDLAYVLDQGVKVAMIYGDRDYICNWMHGERSSLRIPWQSQDNFSQTGYAPLMSSSGHHDGFTRQYGNLSFSRVFQAGHMVPTYQAEISYDIFMRALQGKDVATGKNDVQALAANGQQYQTEGPSDTWWFRNEVPPAPPHECYSLSPATCTKGEKDAVLDGTALIEDWIVVG